MSLLPATVEILKYLPSKYVTIYLLIKAMEMDIQKNDVDKDLIKDLYKYNILTILNEHKIIKTPEKIIIKTPEMIRKTPLRNTTLEENDKALDENFGDWESSFSNSDSEENV